MLITATNYLCGASKVRDGYIDSGVARRKYGDKNIEKS